MGVDNVLNTALGVPTLEKVVVTSSVAAVAASCKAVPPEYLYSERDWNRVATDHYLPYNRQALLFPDQSVASSSQGTPLLLNPKSKTLSPKAWLVAAALSACCKGERLHVQLNSNPKILNSKP